MMIASDISVRFDPHKRTYEKMGTVVQIVNGGKHEYDRFFKALRGTRLVFRGVTHVHARM